VGEGEHFPCSPLGENGGSVAAASKHQVEDSILLRPLLNAAAAAPDTCVDWDKRFPSTPFADTTAVCVLHYVAARMAEGAKVSVKIGAYDPGFPPAGTSAASVSHSAEFA
jgi:hypothetical protein